jgi:nicotinamide riboside kinase
LAIETAKTLSALCVPEYARQYLSMYNGNYSAHDVEIIARSQYALERMMFEVASDYLICDTGPLVLDIWYNVRFEKSTQFVEDWIGNWDYDFVFLCVPNIPWEPDPLRENPSDRMTLYQKYKRRLDELGVPYTAVGDTSLEARLKMVKMHLKV